MELTRKQIATLWCALNCGNEKLTYRVQQVLERACGTDFALKVWDKTMDATQEIVYAEMTKLEKALDKK